MNWNEYLKALYCDLQKQTRIELGDCRDSRVLECPRRERTTPAISEHHSRNTVATISPEKNFHWPSSILSVSICVVRLFLNSPPETFLVMMST